MVVMRRVAIAVLAVVVQVAWAIPAYAEEVPCLIHWAEC